MVDDNSQLIALPDRKEITLCEAVTAFAYGKAYDVRQFDRVRSAEAPIKEHLAKLDDLLERLREAAYAGRINFRGIKEFEDPANGYKTIDPLYFYTKPLFNWSQDVIIRLEDESSTPWYFVHLDREQFASLLRGMDVSVGESDSNHPDVPQERKTGLQGRPSSLYRALELAESRLNARDYPATKTEFAKQIAEAVEKIRPRVPKTGQKALMNNAEFKELWRTLGPKK